ncbi:helix-hairpin-helix domain-containing protein [Paenibacillus lentus]|uniref:DUF4339 domain-containing protein n=1 Tax=Paenibacillus lentus TaxID=1338368 RepID=A0A3Q8S990_9BACL|nr:helix-hairpin-helix domain-containing protein [Paenibacillus lentus]AZK45381.1 DUF4339 domain-containing protein [Paenibacillus lentus]
MMGFINFNQIRAICANYSGPGYFVEEIIQHNKLSKFYRAISIPVQGYAIAFIDATVFGSGKNGLLITEAGVYWRNDWMTDTKQNYLNWQEFIQVEIIRSGDHDIELGPGNLFNMSGSQFNKDDLVQLLRDIQNYTIQALEVTAVPNDKYSKDELRSSPPAPPTSEWMVAIAGQTYGPYDAYLIKSLVGSGQIRPEQTHVWKPGMPDWIPFMRQPELAELIKPAMPQAPLNTQGMPAPPSVEESIELALNPRQAGYEVDIVDVNTASRDELIEVLGVGVAGAERIVQQREAIGGFRFPEQIGELLSLKPHQVERLRRRAIFTSLPRMEPQPHSMSVPAQQSVPAAHQGVASSEGLQQSLSPPVLDLNTASEGDIADLPGVGVVLAKKAIQYRQSSNGFRAVDEFFEMLGLKEYAIERIRPLVTVRSSAPTPLKPNVRVVDY